MIDVEANDLTDIYAVTNREDIYFLIQTVENNSVDDIQIVFKSYDTMNYYSLRGSNDGKLEIEYGPSRTTFTSIFTLTKSEINYNNGIEIRISNDDLKTVGINAPENVMLCSIKLINTIPSGEGVEEFGDRLDGIYIDIPYIGLDSDAYRGRKILVDGKPEEWGSITPLITDPEGDFRKVNGSDLKAIYAAIYNGKIYFMIERYVDEIKVVDVLKLSYFWEEDDREKLFEIIIGPGDLDGWPSEMADIYGPSVPEGTYRWPKAKPAVSITTYPGTDLVHKTYYTSPEITYGQVTEFALPFEAFQDIGFDDPSKITFWGYTAWIPDPDEFRGGDINHPDRYISIQSYT
ncbi:hypothetical protein BMS3Abin16_01465 [archaeon BMS3Abin16]|nr:hypothetical protein BMS3Abin16_01465 [archaeon BMS3Abin16]